MEETTARGQVSRRTIAKGMAWAAPAIPVVAMAPKAAASPAECIQIAFGGAACKWPGANNIWSYNIELCFTNTCQTDQPVTIDYLLNNSGKALAACTGESFEGDSPIIVPANSTGDDFCVGPYPYSSSSSANFIDVYGWVGTVSGPPMLLARLATAGQNPLPDCAGTTPCTSAPE